MSPTAKNKQIVRRRWEQNRIAPNWWNSRFGPEEYSVCARNGLFVPSVGGAFATLDMAMLACESDARDKANRLTAAAQLILNDLS